MENTNKKKDEYIFHSQNEETRKNYEIAVAGGKLKYIRSFGKNDAHVGIYNYKKDEDEYCLKRLVKKWAINDGFKNFKKLYEVLEEGEIKDAIRDVQDELIDYANDIIKKVTF